MRTIVLNNHISYKELISRKQYMETITGLYFIPYAIDEGIELKSIPSTILDYIFIIGHNISVSKYLLSTKISEKNMIIISCIVSMNIKKYKDKNIYVTFGKDGKTNYYCGKEWWLNYNVTKEELKLINTYGSFDDRVKKVFRRLK